MRIGEEHAGVMFEDEFGDAAGKGLGEPVLHTGDGFVEAVPSVRASLGWTGREAYPTKELPDRVLEEAVAKERAAGLREEVPDGEVDPGLERRGEVAVVAELDGKVYEVEEAAECGFDFDAVENCGSGSRFYRQ